MVAAIISIVPVEDYLSRKTGRWSKEPAINGRKVPEESQLESRIKTKPTLQELEPEKQKTPGQQGFEGEKQASKWETLIFPQLRETKSARECQPVPALYSTWLSENIEGLCGLGIRVPFVFAWLSPFSLAETKVSPLRQFSTSPHIRHQSLNPH